MQTKVLVVDDEPDITASIRKGLEFYGFAVDAFTDPLEALSRFKPDIYDLLLIDIRMPKMNGFELCRELRKIDNKCGVCFITAFETYYDEFAKAFPEFDVRRFIRKPLTTSELVARINTALTKRIPV